MVCSVWLCLMAGVPSSLFWEQCVFLFVHGNVINFQNKVSLVSFDGLHDTLVERLLFQYWFEVGMLNT